MNHIEILKKQLQLVCCLHPFWGTFIQWRFERIYFETLQKKCVLVKFRFELWTLTLFTIVKGFAANASDVYSTIFWNSRNLTVLMNFPYHQWLNYNIDESIFALFGFHLNLIRTFIAWPLKYQVLLIHSHALPNE